MRDLGNFRAMGLIVCVSPLKQARLWTGSVEDEGDFWPLVHAPNQGLVSSHKTAAGNDYLLFNMESRTFSLLSSADSFLIVNVVMAPRRYDRNEAHEALLANVGGEPLMRLPSFGGTVAVFDATAPGDVISLRSAGVQHTFGGWSPGSPPDVAVLRLKKGAWSVFGTRLEREKLFLTGALFRRDRSGPGDRRAEPPAD
jgi:hypothetical protein